VEQIGSPRQPRSTVVGRESFDVGIVLEPEGLQRPDQLRLVGAAVDIDPQEALVAE